MATLLHLYISFGTLKSTRVIPTCQCPFYHPRQYSAKWHNNNGRQHNNNGLSILCYCCQMPSGRQPISYAWYMYHDMIITQIRKLLLLLRQGGQFVFILYPENTPAIHLIYLIVSLLPYFDFRSTENSLIVLLWPLQCLPAI